jgi:flagellar basal-body rod protein FlgF
MHSSPRKGSLVIRGMYSAASALDTAATNQELVAENLAHASTPGYRRQGLLFAAYNPLGESSPESSAPASRISDVRAAGSFTQFEPGPIQQTGNPLDLVINGNAFFVLDGPNGPIYTRNGSFQMNAQGQLQTSSGYRVRGQGGPITFPSNVSTISVNSDGVVYANGTEVSQLQLATFQDPAALQRVGPTLFAGPAPQAPPAGTVRVAQGYREGSNVQVVNEMISMMLGMRYYEAAERALRSLSDAASQATRPDA